MAEKMGLDDVVEQLLKNLEKERRMIFGEYNEVHFYGIYHRNQKTNFND